MAAGKNTEELQVLVGILLIGSDPIDTMRECSGLYVRQKQWNINKIGHTVTRMEVYAMGVPRRRIIAYVYCSSRICHAQR